MAFEQPNARDRRATILDLINKKPIGSQRGLGEALSGLGIVTTQATLSRDLKALKLAKVSAGEGWRYVQIDVPMTVEQPAQAAEQSSDLLTRIQALEEAVFGRSAP